MPDIVIRTGTLADRGAVQALYRDVAATRGGLARHVDEITEGYVRDFVEHSLADGIFLIAERATPRALVGELHAYRNGLRNFSHVLGNLTVAVHPSAQGLGIGRRLFGMLLEQVHTHHPEIGRIELVAQESNVRAIALYESLGFRREGRFEAGSAVLTAVSKQTSRWPGCARRIVHHRIPGKAAERAVGVPPVHPVQDRCQLSGVTASRK
ncbi:MAG: N-acetyltransferase [Tahibacter sp.]